MPKRTAPVEEVPVALAIGGRHEVLFRATPADLKELVAGHLLATGRIRRLSDLRSLEVNGAPASAVAPAPPLRGFVVRVELAESVPRLDPAHPAEPVHALGCPTCRSSLRVGEGEPPDADSFGRQLEALYAHSRRYADTGGVHAAGLSDGERLLHTMEDVGRHNAVDKAIGAGLLGESPLSRSGLILSARISGEIAYKAARAGLAWVASRSLPTTLAVAIGRAAGLPLVARAGKTPTVYS